jgi:hypothetical protein
MSVGVGSGFERVVVKRFFTSTRYRYCEARLIFLFILIHKLLSTSKSLQRRGSRLIGPNRPVKMKSRGCGSRGSANGASGLHTPPTISFRYNQELKPPPGLCFQLPRPGAATICLRESDGFQQNRHQVIDRLQIGNALIGRLNLASANLAQASNALAEPM